MSNRELRALARARLKGRWGFLLAVLLIDLLATTAMSALTVWRKAVWLTPVTGILGGLLGLGQSKIYLEQLEGGPKKLGGMVFWARKTLIWKALTVTAVCWGSSMLVNQAIGLFSGVAWSLLWIVASVLLFPLGYVLLFCPGERVAAQIKRAIRLGWNNFWRIFAYDASLYLPYCVIAFALMIPLYPIYTILIRFHSSPYAVLILINLSTVWYHPYLFLAETALAGELFRPGMWGETAETGQGGGFRSWLGLDGGKEERRVRSMKLCGGGGWYYCVMGEGPAPGGPLKSPSPPPTNS